MENSIGISRFTKAMTQERLSHDQQERANATGKHICGSCCVTYRIFSGTSVCWGFTCST